MHKLHQDRRWGGGKCRILRVPRFSSWQIWRHRGKHQETTIARTAFTRLQSIWRWGKFGQRTKLRILNSNRMSLLLFGVEIHTYIHTYILFLVFTLRITEWTCPRIAYASPGGSWLQEWNERIVEGDNDWPQQTGMCFTARSCGDFGPAI